MLTHNHFAGFSWELFLSAGLSYSIAQQHAYYTGLSSYCLEFLNLTLAVCSCCSKTQPPPLHPESSLSSAPWSHQISVAEGLLATRVSGLWRHTLLFRSSCPCMSMHQGLETQPSILSPPKNLFIYFITYFSSDWKGDGWVYCSFQTRLPILSFSVMLVIRCLCRELVERTHATVVSISQQPGSGLVSGGNVQCFLAGRSKVSAVSAWQPQCNDNCTRSHLLRPKSCLALNAPQNCKLWFELFFAFA